MPKFTSTQREVKDRRTQIEGSADPVWWGLAALMSVVSLSLPRFLSMETADHTTAVIVVESALFFSGALLGCLRPRRVWRWALASLLAFAIRDGVRLLADPRLSGSALYTGMLSSVAANSPMYVIQCLPVLAGAYMGSLITSAGLR